MNDAEVQNQIQQMVQFIHQEAKEKAAEIKLKTDEEFNIEKLRMVESEKQKIRAEFERKEKLVEVERRIQQSNAVRLARLKELKSRDEAMQGLLTEVAAKLPDLKKGSAYGKLLEALLVEALKRLSDQKVTVMAVKGEEAATGKAITSATTIFKTWATSEFGAEWAAGISVTLDAAETLPTNAVAGVKVAGLGGKITLTNTLASRLALAYETYQPKLRALLFDN